MNKKLSIAMAVALAGMSGVAAAEDNMGLSFSANVTLTSDYLFRGLSLSDNDPAIQGGFDAEHTSGVYAGVWASSIEPVGTIDDGVNSAPFGTSEAEIDVYIGWAGDLGPVGVDVGVVEYMYPGAKPDADYTEFYVGGSGEIGPVGVGLTYYDSDDFDGQQTWELTGEVPVGMVTLSAVWGTNDFDTAGADYDWWGIGASTELGGFEFALQYQDTDIDADPEDKDLVSDLWAFSISKSL